MDVEMIKRYLEHLPHKREDNLRGVITPPERKLIKRITDDFSSLMEIAGEHCERVDIVDGHKVFLTNIYLAALMEVQQALEFLNNVENISKRSEIDGLLKKCEVDMDCGINSSFDYLKDILK